MPSLPASLALPPRSRLALLAAIFVPLALLGLLVDSENPLFLTYTDPRILEFLLGALIGRLWLAGAIPSPAAGLGLIAVAIAGLAFVGLTYVGFNAWVLGPLAAALVTGVLALEKAGGSPHRAPLTWLGDSSYSIYLWHTFAISVVAKAAGRCRCRRRWPWSSRSFQARPSASCFTSCWRSPGGAVAQAAGPA